MVLSTRRFTGSHMRIAAATALLVMGLAAPALVSAREAIPVLVAQAVPDAAPTIAAPVPANGPPGGTMTIERFNVIAMVRHADIVVQFVMGFLVLCSITTWTILIEKSLLLRRVQRASTQFLGQFRGGHTMSQIATRTGDTATSPVSKMWQAAKEEWDVFEANHTGLALTVRQADQLMQRMVVAANIVQEHEMERLSNSMGILATIGSTAPFIGLFGTVWGILNSFIGIAASHATSLAVVAPGIAEALLATAIGLFAAIPAVMVYNKFARQISRITGTLDNFQGELSTVVSRQLEVVG
jgi:TolQ protein